jgi:hypothetical protein
MLRTITANSNLLIAIKLRLFDSDYYKNIFY